MQVDFLELDVVHAERVGARANVGVSGIDRLTHHIAELAGSGEPSGSGHAQRLDDHQVTAGRRPRHSRYRADFRLLLGVLERVGGIAEDVDHHRVVDDPCTLLAVGLLARPFAHE